MIVFFIQEQIWASEKDERVKNLLKNKEMLGMQKKLFSHDLKTFTNKLQTEMKNRLQKITELEQKIKLEGNIEIREQQQSQLLQQHIEFEEYLDNINDMTAKLDITILFLKEIKKDLTAIKQKIDKLQDTVNDIGADVRKLRGKTFQELLQIRKKKILEGKKFRDLTSVYIPLYVLEYDPITGKPEQKISLLLKDESDSTTGKLYQFLVEEAKTKDVMLLKGLAGSGKSRAAAKIEEVLWEKNDLQQSPWFPVYVSLPTLKEPRFNLLDQALSSEFYSFDKIQIKEFQEAVKKKQLKIILILDSYDEMRQEFIESNLYLTNKLSQTLVEENSTSGQISDNVKLIITTRTEILTSSTNYQMRFYGKSLDSLKEIELQGFNEKQQKQYLEQYTFMTVKQELYELYEFVKHAISEKIDLQEFNSFWKQVEIILAKSQHLNQGNILTEEETNKIVMITKNQCFFTNISQDQIINLRKRLFSLWSYEKFEDIISKTKIGNILSTPFMMEIVVQVLPSMMQKYSDASLIKSNFISNFINIRKQLQYEQQLINLYRNNLGRKPEVLPGDLIYQVKNKDNFEKEANQKWDVLNSTKFLQDFSALEAIKISSLFSLFKPEDTKIVIQAFRMKALSVFDFYSAFTEFYHHRSIYKLREQGNIINTEVFLMDVFDYSQSLAIDLTIRELTQVKYDAKGQLKLTHKKNNISTLEDEWKDIYFDDTSRKGEYQQLVRRCALLTLKGSNHLFTHKSIQEFYVASYLLQYFQEVIKSGAINDETDLYNYNQFNLSKDHFSGVLQLSKEKMNEYQELPNELIKIVKLSTGIPPKYVRAASNSMFLLSYINQYLGHQDFQNISIQNTNLFGLSFYHSNLEGSKFDNVNISSCNFNKANLNHVKWKLISCNELPLMKGHANAVTCVAFSPDGQILTSSSKDQTICQWDFKTGEQLTILEGHTLNVNSVAYSPDGQILTSGSDDKTIRLWDVKAGKELALLEGHTAQVTFVTFSPNGKFLASSSRDETIRLWDVEAKQQLAILEGHTSWVNSVAFSPEGQILASCSEDMTIRLWDIKAGKSLIFLEGSKQIRSVAFSLDGQILASTSCCNQTIRLQDVKSGKQLALLEGHTNDVCTVAFSPDGRILASCSDDRTVRVWDVKAGKQLALFEGHNSSVLSVAFSLDGLILATGGGDKIIRLWDVEAGKKISLLEGHSNTVTYVAFSPGGQILATGSNDKTVRLWDVNVGKQLTLLQGHTDNVRSVAFSPDGQLLASSSNDRTIRLWDFKAGKSLALIEGHTDNVRSVAFSPDGQMLSSSSDDTTIRLWDVESGKQLALLEGHTSKVNSIIFSSNGRIFASSSEDNTIRLWDVKTWKQLHLFKDFKSYIYIRSISFSPNGEILASGSGEGHICLWDIKAAQQLTVLEGHTINVNSVSFSPDGQILASSSNDKTIRLWEIKTYKQLAIIHQSVFTTSIAYSPDGQILASSSDDNTTCLWDVNAFKSLDLLVGHAYLVKSVAFSPDGQILATGSDDKTIRLWDVRTGEQLALLQNQTTNSLQFTSDGQILEVQTRENLTEFRINKNPQLAEIHLTQLQTLPLTEQYQQDKLNIEKKSKQNKEKKLFKISTEILCLKVLGQRYPFQSKNCLITGAKISSNYLIDLTPLFKQRKAVDLSNI